MREHTSGERDVLKGRHYRVWRRAFLADASGTLQPLHNLNGCNFLRRVEWGKGLDQPLVTGTLTLRREVDRGGVRHSLSPLMSASPENQTTGSYAPFVHPFRRLTVWTATLPHDVLPDEGDWRQVFEGIVDDPDFGGNLNESLVSVPFRDAGAVLLDARITERRTYSDNTFGMPAEVVMRQILDDNGFAGVELVTPVSPGWILYERVVEPDSLLTALRAIALEIGWELSYEWQADHSFRLTFYAPNRETDTAHTTIAPSEYLNVTSLRLRGTDVRNRGVVKFFNRDLNTWDVATWEHAGSVAQFGPRPIEIAEDRVRGVTRRVEAEAFIQRVIHDLHTPVAEQEIELRYWWLVSLGDVYDFAPNGVHYDEVQRWGVVAWRHVLDETTRRTTIRTRGAPAGAYRRWLDAAGTGRPLPGAAAPAIESFGEAAAAGENGDGAIWYRIQFDPQTDTVAIHAVTGEVLPLPMPGDATNMEAVVVRRGDGLLDSALDWRTYVAVATTPDYWRKARLVARDREGRAGRITIDERQAVNAISGVSLPPVTGLTITRAGDTNTLHFTTGTAVTPDEELYPVVYLVRRNDIVVAEIPDPGPGAQTFDDPGLLADIPYNYEVIPWCHGITSTTGAGEPPEGEIDEPGVHPDAPVFTEGTPVLGYTDPPLPEIPRRIIRLAWTCPDPNAVRVSVEYLASGGSWVVVTASGDTVAGAWTDHNLYRRVWRLRSYDLAGNLLHTSAATIVSEGPLL